MTTNLKYKLFLQIFIYLLAILWSLPTLLFSAADMKFLVNDIYYFILYFLTSACYITSLLLIIAFCILLLNMLYRKCCLIASWGLMSATMIMRNVTYCMKYNQRPFCSDNLVISMLAFCLLLSLFVVFQDFENVFFAHILGWISITLSTIEYITSGIMLTPVAGYFILLSFTARDISSMMNVFYTEILESKLKTLRKKYDWRKISEDEYKERYDRLIDKYQIG